MLSKSHVKFIHDLAQKKAVRDEHGMFIAEGPKAVEDFLSSDNVSADEIYATDDWLLEHYDVARDKSRFLLEVSGRELERVSRLKTPNQVVAVFHKPDFYGVAKFDGQLSLMLDGLQDPGNLGTIIRCADWFGVKNVVCSLTCADAFNPKVVQATMGSLARVQVHYVDLVDFVKEHKDVALCAAALNGVSVYEVGKISEGFLLIGNEARGVSETLMAEAAKKITIPRLGEAESLNAAVAAGIILSHVHPR